MILPLHTEGRLNAGMLERLGVGFPVPSETTFDRNLADFVGDYVLRERAAAVAFVLGQRPLADSGPRLVEAVTALA